VRHARWLLLAALLLGSLLALLRPLRPGQAGWRREGELLVPGAWQLVPRWRFVPLSGTTVAAQLALASREGVRVQARVRVAFPPGRYQLAAGESASDGLAAALAGTLPAPELACLAGIATADCPERLRRKLQEAVAARWRLAPEVVGVELEVDPQALVAVRLAALRARLAPAPRRVLLLGWDGADWELLEPLARRGVMPTLGQLMARGTWGKLRSITPLLSPIIWTTIATGERPEAHGVLDFLEVDSETGAKVPVTGRKRTVPALWNIASAMGLGVAVSGWWATWPAEVVNGVLVSDRLFFLLSDAVGDAPAGTVVFPPEREAAFRQLAQRAREETDERAVRALLPVSAARFAQAVREAKGMADPVDGFRRILEGTRVYLGAGLEMLQAKPQLAMIYAIGTDEVGHVLAPYLPPPLPGAEASFSEAAQQGVERYFAVMDRWLARLSEACPLAECALVLVSDHGFKWGEDRPREFSGVAAATAALWHRPEGVFLLAGSGVQPLGKVSEPASVYDVAPTVAALLGLPPGSSWPGRPLPGVAPSSLPPVDWKALLPPESYRPKVSGAAPSPEYVAQLKALGYLEGSEGKGAAGGATEGELNNLGLVHLEAGRFQEAEAAFRKALAANPRYASPYYNLRRLYFETGRYDEADAALEQAVRLGLRDGVGAVARAVEDYQRSGLGERALRLARKGRELFPEEPRFAAQTLALAVQLQRCQEGLEEAESATQRFPTDPRVLAFAGLAAACAGDEGKAKAWLARSLELAPDQPEIRKALQALGWK